MIKRKAPNAGKEETKAIGCVFIAGLASQYSVCLCLIPADAAF